MGGRRKDEGFPGSCMSRADRCDERKCCPHCRVLWSPLFLGRRLTLPKVARTRALSAMGGGAREPGPTPPSHTEGQARSSNRHPETDPEGATSFTNPHVTGLCRCAGFGRGLPRLFPQRCARELAPLCEVSLFRCRRSSSSCLSEQAPQQRTGQRGVGPVRLQATPAAGGHD